MISDSKSRAQMSRSNLRGIRANSRFFPGLPPLARPAGPAGAYRPDAILTTAMFKIPHTRPGAAEASGPT
jgi:hypothetical protein